MIFEKKTGNYVGKGGTENTLGRVDDTLFTTINLPTLKSTPSDVLHPTKDLTTDFVAEDLARIARGRGEAMVSDAVRERVRALGMDPDHMPRLRFKQRQRVHNEMVRWLEERVEDRRGGGLNRLKSYDKVEDALRDGRDSDHTMMVGPDGKEVHCTIADLRRALGLTADQYAALSRRRRVDAMNAAVERLSEEEAGARSRDVLHAWLREWARGPLTVERPSGSSLHHLIDYDLRCTTGTFGRSLLQDEDCQVFVVENNWGAAVPPMEGEWRLPFQLICWEFRLSGVRVLAFTDSDAEDVEWSRMWLVYGHGGHWVMDDYIYDFASSGVHKRAHTTGEVHEFPRVVALVHACIRSSCIMIDAEVARHEHVAVPAKLAQRRERESRAPLRDHYVVRLLRDERRVHRAGGAGSGHAEARAPQRGHWRKGTWVHYDDPDSGQVQYPNEGGFVVSKTWRRWHFAGDPNNIIHKEYRL